MCKLPEGNTNISIASFAYGLVGTGLLSSIRAAVTAGSNVADARRADLAAFASGAAATLPVVNLVHSAAPSANSDAPDFVNQMCSAYLAGGLEALSSALYGEATSQISTDLGVDLAALLLSFAFLLVLYFLWYRPLLLATDAEIKRTRVLLLLLPEDVIKSTPALVRAASRYASGG